DLQAEPRRNVVGQDPLRQFLRIEEAVRSVARTGGRLFKRRRKQNRVNALSQPVILNKVARKFVVGAVGQDELQLVVRPERLQILEGECIRLTRVRTLYVDDLDDLFRDPREWTFAAGLKQNLVVGVQKLLHQGDDFALLQHRLAAGDLDEPAGRTESSDLAEHFLQRHLASAVKAELAVAPGAAQITSSQSHEDAGQAGVR